MNSTWKCCGIAALACAVLLSMTTSASAKQLPQAPRYYSAGSGSSAGARHHEPGAMIRYTIGTSYMHASAKSKGLIPAKVALHGAALDMDLAVGFSFSEHFALHATGRFWRVFKPKVKIESGGASYSQRVRDQHLTDFGVGAGITGWFASNGFASVSVLATRLQVNVSKDLKGVLNDQTSKWGVGADLMFGKEWWLSDKLGAGLAAAVTFFYIPIKEDNVSGMFGYTIGPRLTITIN